ncbi:hypothetical protein OG259_00835 [Streptomyces sp. NBC_00250]|uniref:hypothetical protein n=1 Tax=Streptomyces sp. NBC_00250 TaxID=2903641 RepID=UPI002E2DD9E0|nr:hypothetical protein [Streptomyces sp. NBC_00250]
MAEAAAAVAVFDQWGRRGLSISGAIVLIGILTAPAATTTTLVSLWFQETEYTPYMPAVFPLFVWSLRELSVAIRAMAWRGTPHPAKIAASKTLGLVRLHRCFTDTSAAGGSLIWSTQMWRSSGHRVSFRSANSSTMLHRKQFRTLPTH